jgi:hypothetical protein
MSAADVYLARAAALRSEARFHTGRAKRRFLERADACSRMAGAEQRLFAVEPATTLLRRDGQPVLGTAEV